MDESGRGQTDKTGSFDLLSLPRRTVAALVAGAVVAALALAYVSQQHVAGARKAERRLALSMELSETVLQLGRAGPSSLAAMCTELAEEVDLAAKASALSNSDLDRIQRLLDHARQTTSLEERRTALTDIRSILEARTAGSR